MDLASPIKSYQKKMDENNILISCQRKAMKH